ncbi:MAG: hypothetical protein V8Q76_07155 [Bacteroides intestinalis]
MYSVGDLHCFLGGGVQLGGGEGEAGAEVGGLEVGAEVGLFFLHQGLQGVEVLLQVVEVLLRCVLAVQLFFGFFEPLGQLVVGAGGVEGVLLLYEASHLDVAALHLAQVEVDDEGGDADGQCEDGEQGDAGVEAADGALLAADLQALLTGVADGGELEGVAVAGAGVDAVLQGLAAALPEEGFGGWRRAWQASESWRQTAALAGLMLSGACWWRWRMAASRGRAWA